VNTNQKTKRWKEEFPLGRTDLYNIITRPREKDYDIAVSSSLTYLAEHEKKLIKKQ